MLQVLSSWFHGSSWSSLASPAPQVQESQHQDAVDVVATWAASLPIDLILEILLRLEPAAVIRCASVCKPWRRAIISNASILGPRLDHFLRPSLLLGILHYDRTAAYLQCTPGPFQAALSSNGGSGGNETPANSLIPAAAFAALPRLLSSRDGFILLTAITANCLCLCNPMTGYCTIVPAAAGKHCKYILLTGSSSSDHVDPVVRILAVHRRREISILFLGEETLAFQLFSTSGDRAWAWGPVVQCSGDHLEQGHHLYVRLDRRSTAVGRDAVYWLAGPGHEVTCIFSLDVHTGKTWTTKLQKPGHVDILGMSSDGRLFLVQSRSGPCIKVWLLTGDSEWCLHQTISIDMRTMPPQHSDISRAAFLSAFCPQSRCVVALWSNQELLIDIDIDSSGLSLPIRRIGKHKGYHCHCCPYEIDSSTYISKMKQF